MTAAGLAEVVLRQTHASGFLLDVLLEPLGFVYIIIGSNAWLSELISQIIQGGEQLCLVGPLVF